MDPKEQEEANGKLIAFKELGEVGNLISESVYVKGLECVVDAPERIKNRMKPVDL